MPITSLNPYAFFDGNAREAIALYEAALGAKAEGVMSYADVPDNSPAPANKDRVMHALLHIGESKLMVSDTPEGKPASSSSNVEIVLDYTDLEEMKTAFDAMSAGGEVTMPIEKAFWGAHFGNLVDRFGIRWMFNCNAS